MDSTFFQKSCHQFHRSQFPTDIPVNQIWLVHPFQIKLFFSKSTSYGIIIRFYIHHSIQLFLIYQLAKSGGPNVSKK